MPAAAHGIAWKRVEALINLAAVFDKLFRLFFQKAGGSVISKRLRFPRFSPELLRGLPAAAGRLFSFSRSTLPSPRFFADNFRIKVKMKRTRLI
jgi:hypothetical protein